MTLEEKIKQLRAAEKRLRKHLSEDEFGVVGRTAEGFGQEADWLEELKRYRDLEEQGRLLVLPCKVGKYEKRLVDLEKAMDEKTMEILKVFDLDGEADVLATNLPYGKQRKLEIARAMATEPKLLLLDEPAAGMNPNETGELMETIQFVREHFGMTILLIEHDMKLVSGICEELTVLNFGQVLAQGKTADVLNNPEVISAYLGDE